MIGISVSFKCMVISAAVALLLAGVRELLDWSSGGRRDFSQWFLWTWLCVMLATFVNAVALGFGWW